MPAAGHLLLGNRSKVPPILFGLGGSGRTSKVAAQVAEDMDDVARNGRAGVLPWLRQADVQAAFRRRRHQPRRPPLAKIEPRLDEGASAIVVQKNLAASKKQNKSTRICVQ